MIPHRFLTNPELAKPKLQHARRGAAANDNEYKKQGDGAPTRETGLCCFVLFVFISSHHAS
jgi:hypothetical protein